MEHIDVELLQNAPALHMQTVLKTRNISAKSNQNDGNGSLAPTPTEMAQSLFAQHDLLQVLRSLDQLEASILKELVASRGRANSRDLALYFSTIISVPESTLPPVRPSYVQGHATNDDAIVSTTLSPLSPGSTSLQYPVAHPHGLFELAVRHMLLLGLLFWGKQTAFVGRDYASGIHDGVLIVPEAVKAAVLQVWSNEEPFVNFIESPSRPEEDTNVSEGTEGIRALQRSLYLYWSLVASQDEGLSLVNTGLLARASLRQVLEHVGNRGVQGLGTTGTPGAQAGTRMVGEQIRVESDAPYLLFLRLLLTRLNLLQERDGVILAVNAEPFFRLPLIERARRCYYIWHDSPFWNEMLYLPDVNVRPGPSSLDEAHDEVMHGRQSIVERMEHEQLDEWHTIQTFIARTKLHVPYLLFPRQYGSRTERYMNGSNPYGWDFRLKRGWLTHREGWHMVEGGFIRTVITGPLYWLGIIELDAEHAPTSFCIPKSVRLLLRESPPKSKEESWGRLIVQPNFELVALAPVAEALLIALDRFAERVSLEHIAQYRLTKISVTRAIRLGLHSEDIQRTLEQATGSEIPQNIHYSLAEWERQARRIEVWPDATLLEVDDAAFLDSLFADEATRPLLRRRIAPRLAEVASSQLETLQHLLWQRDFLPSVVAAPVRDLTTPSEAHTTHEPQWLLHSDGLLQPFYAVTDLYLVAELEHFSDSDESTGWRRITVSSLQRALSHGMTLDAIILFLNTYCRHDNGSQREEQGIPASFLMRLKLWGNGYNQQHEIAIEHAPMLRLSPEILTDLLADDEVAPFLNGEVEQSQRLVRVQPQHLERVVAKLREYGFFIE